MIFLPWLYIAGTHCFCGCTQTEMMSEAIDDALDDDEAEEETEDLTNQASIPFFCYF